MFKAHFAEWRRAKSKGLKVTERLDCPNAYTVRNEYKESTYIVETRADGVFCECHDFSNQLTFLGRGCCKHGYAVLNSLGFGSLYQYIQAQKVIPFPRAAEAPAAYAA